jgi:hypothetical protein
MYSCRREARPLTRGRFAYDIVTVPEQRCRLSSTEPPLSVELPLIESDEYEKKEKCGLFGIWGTPNAATIAYQGIFAQQSCTATRRWDWSARYLIHEF